MAQRIPVPAPTGNDWRRFMSKVEVQPDGCWEWKASRFTNGYGMFILDGKQRRAHRVLYVWSNGELPIDLEPDHTCKNKACVNPGHLEPVTGTVNKQQATGRTHCKRGHEFTPENTVYLTAHGKPNGRCCRMCQTDAQRDSKRRINGTDPSTYRHRTRSYAQP